MLDFVIVTISKSFSDFHRFYYCYFRENSDEVKTAVLMYEIKEEDEIKIEEEDVPPQEDPLALCQQGPSWKEGEREAR